MGRAGTTPTPAAAAKSTSTAAEGKTRTTAAGGIPPAACIFKARPPALASVTATPCYLLPKGEGLRRKGKFPPWSRSGALSRGEKVCVRRDDSRPGRAVVSACGADLPRLLGRQGSGGFLPLWGGPPARFGDFPAVESHAGGWAAPAGAFRGQPLQAALGSRWRSAPQLRRCQPVSAACP